MSWSSIRTKNAVAKKSLSSHLNQISFEQLPTEEQATTRQEIALRVIRFLEKEMSSHAIGRVMIAGSYGKGTAIVDGSDYDIVIYFNKIEPPFTNILKTMETALKNNAKKFKGFKWGFRSSIHVCFDIEGIQFDLTPATQLDNNYQWNRWCCFAPSLSTHYPSLQYRKTMHKIAQLKDPLSLSYLYSSSLSIDAVVFVQRQNEFVHGIIRLAKHWARNLTPRRTQIRGKSVLIETIAIHASYSLTPVEMTEKNVEKAFLKFLEYISEANQLRLYVFVNYQKKDIPDSVFNQTPLVLDPVNPYNNLLSPANFHTQALKGFEEAARMTLNKVNAWKQGGCKDFMLFKTALEFP